MKLIVGLGNPGKEYELTRHNIGFMLIDYLIDKLKPTKISKSSFKGELYKSNDILLLKPMTYMNLSGESVISVQNFYKCDDIIVVHDDLDLKFGAIKYKRGGSNGGHNGLKSIDSHCGSEYIRVRLGIDKPKSKDLVVKHVLENFSQQELGVMRDFLTNASVGTLGLLQDDLNTISAKYSQKEIKLTQ